MWNQKIAEFRIQDQKSKIFYPAGSPSQEEINECRRNIEESQNKAGYPPLKTALILGMTPALRLLCHSLNLQVICVDKNEEMINFLADWIPNQYKNKETIIEGNWLEIDEILKQKIDIILGDGVFGNLLSVEKHNQLLQKMRSVLNPWGIILVRKILIPITESFDVREYQAEKLLSEYRKKNIDEAEFGFSMRILGDFQQSYDHSTYLLKNKLIFEKYQNLHRQNILSDQEIEIIYRYFFDQDNLVIPQQQWEKLLENNNFSFQFKKLKGKLWYNYYIIYKLQISN